MSFNGSGTFVINTAGQPVVPNTVISATAFNALTADLANGLSTCITKDGQTTPTANIPMGNNKITGLAAGTAGTDAANLSQVQGSTAKLLQSVTGTDTITAAMVPALTSYSAGQMFYFVAAGDNTGAVTINIDSLGAKSVTRDGSTALVAGDITNGKVVVIVYDGTRFQLLNSNAFTNLYVSGNLGVGTASPAYKVDASGQVRALESGTGSGDGGFVASTSGANGNAGVLFQTNSASRWNLTTAGTNGANLRIYNYALASTVATFDSSGNLGIGTSSPGYRLDVRGTSTDLFQVKSTGAYTFSRFQSSSRNWALSIGSGFSIYDETAAASRLDIDSSGNLGIGTSSPIAKLDVNGNISVSPAASKIAYLTTDVATIAGVSVANYGMTVNCTFTGFTNPGTILSGYDGVLFATSGVERMRLDVGGNLGIGTTGTITNKVEIACASGADRNIFLAGVTGASNGFYVQWSHATTKTHVRIADIPTSSAGLPAGTLWNDSGTLKIT